jgi:AhpD family alkylhydroperoxidase
VATGSVSRAEKEVTAAAVSAANACPYCVTVHSAAARALGNDVASITDPGLKAIAAWARQSGQPQQVPLAHGGFAEIAGVAVNFHYLNRMVTIFLPESPLPPLTPKTVGGWVMDMLASAMVSASPAPGAALDLLPDAPLPAGFSWAAGAPHVAAAFGRAAAVIEEAGERAVPPRVREFVLDALDGWNGQPPGPSRAWADTEVARLPDPDRAAGRLAILTALAPYQVSRADVAELRRSADSAVSDLPGPPAAAGTDETLLALTSWASMAAARRIGSWLPQPAPDGAKQGDRDA